jgi:hypothetical protein
MDRAGRLVGTQHQPIAERLDLLGGMRGQQRADDVVECERDVGRMVIAALRSERGETDEVGEEECALHVPESIRILAGMSNGDHAPGAHARAHAPEAVLAVLAVVADRDIHLRARLAEDRVDDRSDVGGGEDAPAREAGARQQLGTPGRVGGDDDRGGCPARDEVGHLREAIVGGDHDDIGTRRVG